MTAHHSNHNHFAQLQPNEDIFPNEEAGHFNTTTIDDQQYIKAYTDGSLIMPLSLLWSSAGWAVHYGPNNKANYAAPLEGDHQCSYRAETRAILHVVMHATQPTSIYCDCKCVVDKFNNLLQGHQMQPNQPNMDIWNRIQNELAQLQRQDYFKINWIPSHFDEEKNIKKRDKYLKGGGLEEDIQGNIGADKACGEAAALAKPNHT